MPKASSYPDLLRFRGGGGREGGREGFVYRGRKERPFDEVSFFLSFDFLLVF
jgi:hypothetical protein